MTRPASDSRPQTGTLLGAVLGAGLGAVIGASVKLGGGYVFGAHGSGPIVGSACMAVYGVILGAVWGRALGDVRTWRHGMYLGGVVGATGANIEGFVLGIVLGASAGAWLHRTGHALAARVRALFGAEGFARLTQVLERVMWGTMGGGAVGVLIMFIVVSNDGWFARQFGRLLDDEKSGEIAVELISGSLGLGAGLLGVFAGIMYAAARGFLHARRMPTTV